MNRIINLENGSTVVLKGSSPGSLSNPDVTISLSDDELITLVDNAQLDETYPEPVSNGKAHMNRAIEFNKKMHRITWGPMLERLKIGPTAEQAGKNLRDGVLRTNEIHRKIMLSRRFRAEYRHTFTFAGRQLRKHLRYLGRLIMNTVNEGMGL